MTPKPLKGKRKYLGTGNSPPDWLYKHRDVKSAVEWLKSQINADTTNPCVKCGQFQCAVCSFDMLNWIDEAFHDVNKED